MATPFDLEEALKALTGRTAAEHSQQAHVTRAIFESAGLGSPTLQTSARGLARHGSGLLLPKGSGPVPVDYVGVYVTMSQYAGGGLVGLSKDEAADAVIRTFTSQAPRWRLVELLVALNRGLAQPELAETYLAVHREGLAPEVAERFELAWDPRRLHTLEARLESWTSQGARARHRSATRPS